MRKIKLEGDHVIVKQTKDRRVVNDPVEGERKTYLETLVECEVVESATRDVEDKPKTKFYEPGTKVLVDIASADPFFFGRRKFFMIQAWSVVGVIDG